MGGVIVLLLGWIVSSLIGASMWIKSETVMHQMIATGILVIGAIQFTGAIVVDAIRALPQRQVAQQAKVAREAQRLSAEVRSGSQG